jgi:hypothetical protein
MVEALLVSLILVLERVWLQALRVSLIVVPEPVWLRTLQAHQDIAPRELGMAWHIHPPIFPILFSIAVLPLVVLLQLSFSSSPLLVDALDHASLLSGHASSDETHPGWKLEDHRAPLRVLDVDR